MTTPSVASQLREMGRALPKPTKAARVPRAPMKRTSMRRGVTEDGTAESFYLVARDGKRWRWPNHYMLEKDWDSTLQDWAASYKKNIGQKLYTKAFHVTSKIVTEKGWFDFVWMGPAGTLFTEHKVRYQNGAANQLSVWQKEFFATAHEAKADARAWLWPDDAEDAWTTLTGLPWEACPYAREAGKGIYGTWRVG